MKKYLVLLLMLLSTPCFAESNYLVNGDNIYRVKKVSVINEKDELNKEIAILDKEILSYQKTIANNQALLDSVLSKKQDAIARISDIDNVGKTVNTDITYTVRYIPKILEPIPDESIYPDVDGGIYP